MSGPGLGSELEPSKGRKKRSRGVNQRLKVGIRVGARGQESCKYEESPREGEAGGEVGRCSPG